VAGLVYLDAAYQYVLDNGKGTTIAELQKAIRPQVPPQNESDPATFTALQAWYCGSQGSRCQRRSYGRPLTPLQTGASERLADSQATRTQYWRACGNIRTSERQRSRYSRSLAILDLG
jgi:hypothetical protein